VSKLQMLTNVVLRLLTNSITDLVVIHIIMLIVSVKLSNIGNYCYIADRDALDAEVGEPAEKSGPRPLRGIPATNDVIRQRRCPARYVMSPCMHAETQIVWQCMLYLN